MPSIKYISKKEFADLCRVSLPALSKAAKAGNISVASNGKINPNSIKNVKYKVRALARARNRGPTKREIAAERAAMVEDVKNRLVEDEVYKAEVASKTAVEIARIKAQTTKINMDIAREAGRLILREIVEGYFGKLASVFSGLMHPMGQRIAPLIADILDVEDPDIVNRIQEVIDTENERIIGEVQRITDEASLGTDTSDTD